MLNVYNDELKECFVHIRYHIANINNVIDVIAIFYFSFITTIMLKRANSWHKAMKLLFRMKALHSV